MSAVHAAIVYGATAAAQLSDALDQAAGRPSGDQVQVPRDLLALWLTTAYNAGRLDGIREINRLNGVPTC